eukprot:gene7005-8136_t
MEQQAELSIEDIDAKTLLKLLKKKLVIDKQKDEKIATDIKTPVIIVDKQYEWDDVESVDEESINFDEQVDEQPIDTPLDNVASGKTLFGECKETANERRYSVLRDNDRVQLRSQDIMVGDIIHLENDAEVPCDMVLLLTADPEGTCFVQTSNLDGETDLKTRLAPPETSGYTVHDLLRFRGVLECPAPNADVYRFDARMSMRANSPHIFATLNSSMALPCTLDETKIGKNKKIPPTKWTKLDRSINRITIAIFSLQLFLVAVFGIVGEIMRRQEIATFWYLGYEKGYTSPWYEFIVIPMRFLLLNSMMIPISLKVTIDVVKYAYALFINWDLKMYNKATDSLAIANSTALMSEDLGQIEYVFTDKTGTWTENIMIFSKCSIGTQIYGQNCLALDDDKDTNYDFIGSVGRPETYQLLHSFEFTSDRKRMSVVIRNMVSRGIKVVTKGADDVIFPRLVPGPDLEMSRLQIDEFAELGLRTLCVSEREITENDLRQASIKVWMLTGDKYSTAIQIAHSCNLIERGCTIYTVGKDLGDETSKSGAPGNLSTADANIGVGISGREGLQAARAADYSIARFKYLRELIFIHGRYSYLRTAFVANYCFHKSLFICFIQILFQTVSGFAGSTFFNSFSLTSYNIMFTGLPIIGYILDKDLPESILHLFSRNGGSGSGSGSGTDILSYDQRHSKIIKFLLYRKLTSPIAKHLAKIMDGDKEVIEFVVSSQDYNDDLEEILTPAYSYDDESRPQ